MNITTLKIPEVLLLEPKKHGDDRGFFSEVYNKDLLSEAGFSEEFIQDNHAHSKEAFVLRGLHYQTAPFAQDKLVRVISGSIWDVAVDIRTGSPTYGQWVAAEISASNFKQILVPKGFAHGYLTLEPNTTVLYKVSNLYSPESDRGLQWNDPDINIPWPLESAIPILSEKDQVQPNFANIISEFTY